VIKVSEVDRSPRLAQRINAEFGTVFAELIKERFGANNGLPAGVGTPTPITAIVFDPAHVVPGRVSPKPVLDIAIAVVLGIVLGLVALFSWDRLDRSLPQRGDVESAFGVPLIGQIPVRPRSQAETLWDRRSEGSGAYRALSQSLPFLAVTRPLRRLLVASAISGEGKEAVIANLAAAIASSGAKTLVVEGDLRHPLLDALLDAKDSGSSPGLSSVLIGEASLDDAISPITAPRALGGGQFDLLPCGLAPPNPDALLSTARAAEAIQTLAGSYDYVLVDAPPLLAADDALALAPLVDGLVVVARRKRTLADEALKLQGFTERTGVHVVGVVLTDSGRVARDAARRVTKEAPRRQRRAAEPGRADGDDATAALESAVSAPAEDSPPARSRPFARLGVASRVFLLSAGGPAREYDTSASPPNDGEPSPSLRTSSVDETEAALVTTPEEDESASPPIRPKQARSPKHSRD
jgi:capsular exopolysaccharide synthesis family protein